MNKLEQILTHLDHLRMMKDVLHLGTRANEALDYAIELAKANYLKAEKND